MAGGGKSPSSTTTTSVQKLSPQQEELLSGVIPIAKNYLNNPPQQYEGSGIVGFNPLQQQAQQAYLQAAQSGSPLGQFIGGTQGANQFLMGPVLFPESNPALQAATQAAIRPITENFTQNVLPNIRSGSVGTGTYGSSRQGVAEGLASQGYQRQVGDTAATIQSQAYQQGLDAMVKGLYAAPQTAQLGLLPAQLQEAVGSQQQQLAQQQLNEVIQKYVNQQLIPFSVAQDVASLAFGIGGGSSTVNSTGNPYQGGTSPLQGALGGAALGTSIMPGWGTGIGAGIGALFSLFG